MENIIEKKEPKRHLLQVPKDNKWRVKKAMPMNSVVAIPIHQIRKTDYPTLYYYRIGRPLFVHHLQLFEQNAIPLFSKYPRTNG